MGENRAAQVARYNASAKRRAANMRYYASAKGRAARARNNAKNNGRRLLIGQRVVGLVQTAEIAAAINAHVRGRRHAFTRQQAGTEA